MAQRFLAEVARGDKRILLLEGEPLGALLRVPSESELRANLHVGGRAERGPSSAPTTAASSSASRRGSAPTASSSSAST